MPELGDSACALRGASFRSSTVGSFRATHDTPITPPLFAHRRRRRARARRRGDRRLRRRGRCARAPLCAGAWRLGRCLVRGPAQAKTAVLPCWLPAATAGSTSVFPAGAQRKKNCTLYYSNRRVLIAHRRETLLSRSVPARQVWVPCQIDANKRTAITGNNRSHLRTLQPHGRANRLNSVEE